MGRTWSLTLATWLAGSLACAPLETAPDGGSEGPPGDAGAPPGPGDAAARALFDPAAVVRFAFTVDEAALASLRAAPRERVEAALVVTIDGETSPSKGVGLSLKGNVDGTFRELDRKAAFKVRFDSIDEGQRFLGLRGVKLNNMEEDPSQLHEVLAYGAFDHLGVPAARAGYASVTLNDEDYGLHALVERVDDVWAGRHFASTRHIYEATASGVDVLTAHMDLFEVDEGDDDRADLAAVASVAEADASAFWDALRDRTDAEALLRMWAASQIFAHWDGYAGATNNYYLHIDEDGVAAMVPSGLDQALEASWYDVRQGVSPYSVRGVLFERCLASPECASGYERALASVMVEIEGLALPEEAARLASIIAQRVAEDPRREAPVADVQSAQAALRAFLEGRRATSGL